MTEVNILLPQRPGYEELTSKVRSLGFKEREAALHCPVYDWALYPSGIVRPLPSYGSLGLRGEPGKDTIPFSLWNGQVEDSYEFMKQNRVFTRAYAASPAWAGAYIFIPHYPALLSKHYATEAAVRKIEALW